MNISIFINKAPKQIADKFIYKQYLKGQTIIYSDEKNEYLYLLKKGTANVFIQTSDGVELVLYTYSDSSCFGEIEIFNPNIKTHYISCSSDCELILLHKKYVLEWMKIDFPFTKFLIEQLSEKLIYSSNKLYLQSILNIKERIIYSLYLHALLGDIDKLTKEMICHETMFPLRSLNRSLIECRNEGYLTYKNKRFEIISLEKIEKLCISKGLL